MNMRLAAKTLRNLQHAPSPRPLYRADGPAGVYPSRAEPAATATFPTPPPTQTRPFALTLGSYSRRFAGDSHDSIRRIRPVRVRALTSRVCTHSPPNGDVTHALEIVPAPIYSTSYFRGLRPIPVDRLGSSSHAQTGEQYRYLLRMARVVLLSRRTPSRHLCPSEIGPGGQLTCPQEAPGFARQIGGQTVDSGPPPLGRAFFRLVEASNPLLLSLPRTPALPFPTERRASASSPAGKLP
ncbi:hypothetical protein C8J57DRAFT_1728101 [Mycena rebaudengoi]|nr:hypothetical protein C8J57DRAFT_1728101 [Mycena rebaudengoi]